MSTDNKSSGQRAMPILVVDDETSIRTVLTEVLRDDGHEVTPAASAEEALEIFRNGHFSLVVTDIVMPGMTGIQLLQKLKQIQPDTQVVIMTSNASLDTALSALRSGAYDYLIKPFEELDLISAVVNRACDKMRLIQENRMLIDQLRQNNEYLDHANKALKELAIRDGLTGLFNHRHFHEALAVELLRARSSQRIFSLVLLDVDHFKNYNDRHGHPEGDQLLRTLADLMRESVRRSDIIARYGGEEFVILLPETPKERAIQAAEQIRRNVEEYPFKGREDQPLGKLTVSVGVAAYPDDGRDGSSLIEKADTALYQAKDIGRNTVSAS